MQPRLRQLFSVFFKIGAFTFGGGWAMISIIEREIVTRRRWLSSEEFYEQLAIAQSLPGILAVNISASVGDRMRGRAGSVVSALGTIAPSFVIILLIAVFLTPDLINGNEVLSAVFKGIRPAVVALIIAPVVNAAKVAKLNWKTAFIPVVVALAIWSRIPGVSNPVLWIVLGAAAGIWVFRRSMASGRGIDNDKEKDAEEAQSRK